jgi:integrase
MSDLTTIEPTGKRSREGTVLTDRLCETKVAKRKKYFDRNCKALYVSIIPPCVASFYINFTDGAGRPTSAKLGVYHPESFRVAVARGMVYALKAKGGAAIGELLRQQKVTATKQGVTVDQLIEKRIAWMKTLERKDDGEMRPRIESWENTARHLRNFIGPRLGHQIAREVTNDDIATLSNDILEGRYIVSGKARKASPSNCRHARRAASAMFNWALLAGNKFIDVSPCLNLPKLKKPRAKSRVLSETEIRTLWHGLDRDDLPWGRTTRLGLKFALTTMLRSNEMLPIHRSELDLAGCVVNVPARRVKKRRLIVAPLSDLALEIITEAMGSHDYAFTGRFGDAPLSRQAMSGALKGTKKTPGICELLGMKPFTPHDLRRSAATMCERLRLPGSDIALCLDHLSTKDENGNDLPAVTQEVYSLAFEARVARKRAVLDQWAVELRRIIGEPAAELRLPTPLKDIPTRTSESRKLGWAGHHAARCAA